jgi:hypothetical protein
MTCKCGSDRIAQISAKHSDAVSFRVRSLDIDLDGRTPYVNYANGDRFIGGDYLFLVFCLDCGQIQNFTPITDEDLNDE